MCYRLEGKELVPTKVSKHTDGDRLMLDLLLLNADQNYHYCLILNLKNLVNKIKKKKYRAPDKICRNCFHVCSSEERWQRHIKSCYGHEPAVIKMPEEGKNAHTFRNVKARWYHPFVIYYDLESVLCEVNEPSTSNQSKLEQHKPCGFALAAIEHGKPEPKVFVLKREPDCIKVLLQTLEKLARDIHGLKRLHKVYNSHVPGTKASTMSCWICCEPFENEHEKVLDHCHYSGEFLGWSHNRCNMNRSVSNFIPVIAHNSANYDLHHICKNLGVLSPQHKISIIPSTDERYICLDIAIFIRTYNDSNGNVHHVYEHLRFIDSYKFMMCPLEKLVSYLPDEKLHFIDKHFEGYSESERALLKKKGYYPYSYMNSPEKFNETQLPPLCEWRNTLADGEVLLTEKEFQDAQKVYTVFHCRNLGDYHDLYLTVDVLLLASVFEEFRSLCYTSYGLDCVYYYTASNLSGDSFLRICKPDIQLMIEREQLEIVENLLRGGMSSIFSKRFFQANNYMLPNYNPEQPITYGLLLDANNLYGGIMQHYSLPLNNFAIIFDVTLPEILATPKDATHGYILEVDLVYPHELHEEHKDFPLAPSKEVIDVCLLSTFQKGLLRTMGTKHNSKNAKLVQTLYNKPKYTVHYETLKLYVELGLQVTKVHRVLKFAQSRWMAPYIELNTELRKSSKNKFQEMFFKLMVNSVYGKTCESKRNRSSVKLVRTETEALSCLQKHTCKTFKIFDPSLAAITLRPSIIYWNKPTVIGAVILDLAKLEMYAFHYRVMKNYFSCTLLYSDTDSLMYKIETKDLYDDLELVQKELDCFDFSNYPEGHRLQNRKNKMKTLKFKDELAGEVIQEFCGLKPKMYSIQTTSKFDFARTLYDFVSK